MRPCDVYKWRAVECKTILEKFFFTFLFRMPPKKPVAAKAPVKAAAKPAPRPAAGRGTTPAAKKGAVAPGIYKLINAIFTI